jgi:Zn-dependent M28 family amino/carboxypeptidase
MAARNDGETPPAVFARATQEPTDNTDADTRRETTLRLMALLLEESGALGSQVLSTRASLFS